MFSCLPGNNAHVLVPGNLVEVKLLHLPGRVHDGRGFRLGVHILSTARHRLRCVWCKQLHRRRAGIHTCPTALPIPTIPPLTSILILPPAPHPYFDEVPHAVRRPVQLRMPALERLRDVPVVQEAAGDLRLLRRVKEALGTRVLEAHQGWRERLLGLHERRPGRRREGVRKGARPVRKI